MKPRFVVDADFDFQSVSYLPMKKRRRHVFDQVVFNGIALRRPDEADLARLTAWLGEEDIYRPLGFSRSIPRKYIRRSVVPDLTGSMEDVEFLIVRDVSSDRSIGFVIVYEARRAGDADQEVDFALANKAYRGRPGLIRATKLALLAYLFAVCGAETVHWIRRRPPPPAEDQPDPARYRVKGPPVLVDRDGFAAMLKTLEKADTPKGLPVVALGADHWRHSTT